MRLIIGHHGTKLQYSGFGSGLIIPTPLVHSINNGSPKAVQMILQDPKLEALTDLEV